MSDTAIPDSVMQKAREVAQGNMFMSSVEHHAKAIALAILAAQQEATESAAAYLDAKASEIEAGDSNIARMMATIFREQATAIRAKGQ